jgi:hypothetical protein
LSATSGQIPTLKRPEILLDATTRIRLNFYDRVNDSPAYFCLRPFGGRVGGGRGLAMQNHSILHAILKLQTSRLSAGVQLGELVEVSGIDGIGQLNRYIQDQACWLGEASIMVSHSAPKAILDASLRS